MAGGRWLRLHPLTDSRPKPMLRVGGKPILEQIIEGFSSQGFKRFWLCLNYKADVIQGYFGDGGSRGVKIKYVHEEHPLGTGGALNLLPKFETPFIVSNADILAKIKYGELMEFHARSNVQATVCLGLHQYQVPYGVAEVRDEFLVGIREKPIKSEMVNAGIYVIEPKALDHAPSGPFDMPDLISKLENVAAYPIEGFWLDVGHFEALGAANQEWES